MKILNKIVLGASMLAALSLTSCEDGLTTKTQSAFDASVVFSNPVLAEYNVLSIYEVFTHTNSHRGRYLPWYGFNTDIELYNSTKDDEKSAIGRYSSLPTNSQLNTNDNPYNELFGGIERANLAIDGIRKYGNPEGDITMAKLLAEAYTARALMYVELLKAYGEVPARLAPVTGETTYINKADKDVIYKTILADLEFAFNYLDWPLASSITSTVVRPSLAFAKGLYARIALMASGYSLRPDSGKVGTGDVGTVRLSEDPELQKSVLYPKALAALKDVIDNAGLSLVPDYETLWRDVNNLDKTAGKEVIYVIPFSQNRGRWNYSFAIRMEGNPFDWTTSQTSSRGGSVGPVPTLYWKYGEHDSRRDLSCVNYKWRPGDTKEVQVLAGQNDWYFGKFRFEWMTASPYKGGNDDGIAPVYMRYADILLMAAEIANDPACGARDESFAKKCLLDVRKRAYAGYESEAESYVNGLSGEDEIFNAIVDERAYEFVGEMLRKSDLIRWNLLKTKMDESKAELQAFYNREGRYANFGPALWYRYAADGATLETYGYNEPATLDAAPEGEGWMCYTDSAGKLTEYFKSGESADEKLASFYNIDPNTRQWWPIPASSITASQGSLVNDYGF